MNDQKNYNETGEPANQDDTSVKQTTNNPNPTEQGKINKPDNNTKLENEPDSGDLNDDD